MKNDYIIIVDPQKDFISTSGRYARRHVGISQIIGAKKKISKLLEHYDDRRVVIVYANYRPDQFGRNLSLCVPGEDGHQIDIDLKPSYLCISKSNHSTFSSNEFIRFIDENNVISIYLCGFLAEYCIRSTALDALYLKMEVKLISDCIGTGDDVQERKIKVFDELVAKGARLMESKEVNKTKIFRERHAQRIT